MVTTSERVEQMRELLRSEQQKLTDGVASLEALESRELATEQDVINIEKDRQKLTALRATKELTISSLEKRLATLKAEADGEARKELEQQLKTEDAAVIAGCQALGEEMQKVITGWAEQLQVVVVREKAATSIWYSLNKNRDGRSRDPRRPAAARPTVRPGFA